MRSRSLYVCLVLALAACGKTSKPTPEGTGSGTVTSGGDHSGGSSSGSAGSGSTRAASSGSSADLSDPFERSLVAFTSLRDRMCACGDTACTEKVMADFQVFRGETKQLTVGKSPTQAQRDRGVALDKELRACRVTVEAKVSTGSAMQPSGSASGDIFDLALVDLAAFKTRMCGCKDKPCADAVQADVGTWQRTLRTKLGTTKPTALQDMRGKALEKELKECRAKAEAATPGAPAGDKLDAAIAKMQAFRDRTCACKDKACGDAVTKEIEAWQQVLAKELADAKPSKDQDAKFDKLDGELKACKAKLR